MGFMDSIKYTFSKYATFEGRATRQEWTYFFLLYAIAGLVIGALVNRTDNGIVGLLGLIPLAMLLPMLGVSWRRFHDQGKSGWITLLWLIPVVGWIIYVVLAVRPGEPGPNQYGPNPEDPAPSQGYAPQDRPQGGYGQPGPGQQPGYRQPGQQPGYGQPGPQG